MINDTVKSDVLFENAISQSSKPNEQSDCLNLNNIILKPLLSTKRRRKGSTLNAIGLRKRSTSYCKTFKSMRNFEKATIILQWTLKKEYSDKVLCIDLIDVSDVDILPEVPCWIFNEEVDVSILKPYMSQEAFLFLNNTIKDYKPKWICSICLQNLSIDRSIGCDQCLKWMHFQCEEIKRTPKEEIYYCQKC